MEETLRTFFKGMVPTEKSVFFSEGDCSLSLPCFRLRVIALSKTGIALFVVGLFKQTGRCHRRELQL